MNKQGIRGTAGRLLAILLVAGVGLTACQPRNDTTATVGKALQPAVVELAEVVSSFEAGDGLELALQWYNQTEPRVEAYSFLEYPVEFGRGRAWYWGDWRSRATDYCSVRMLYDYTPVQVDCSLGWLAANSGQSVAKLKQQYLDLHATQGGTVSTNVGHTGKIVGEIYEFTIDGGKVNLFTRDDLGEALAVFGITFDSDGVARVAARNERHPEFKEFGTVDKPATLAELIAIIGEQRMPGVLNQFDYTSFKLHMIYSPPPEWDSADYVEATMYQSGAWWWATVSLCLVSAYDDGTRTQLMFTPGWYSKHAGHPAEELTAEFDSLMAENAHRTLMLDSVNNDYDVDYTFAYIDGVNVIRRKYLQIAGLGHAHYSLVSGPEMYVDAPSVFPAWGAVDLPLAADAGALEGFIAEIATMPLPEVQAAYLPGFQLADDEVPLHESRPFTTRQTYSLMDYDELRYDCIYESLDETWLQEFGFAPRWFTKLTGVPESDLAAEFAALMARCGGDTATAEESASRITAFDYGPLRFTCKQAAEQAGLDAWYTVEFPDWP